MWGAGLLALEKKETAASFQLGLGSEDLKARCLSSPGVQQQLLKATPEENFPLPGFI